MKRVLLTVLLLQVTLLAKSEFMKMCENPTDSQLITLHAIMEKKEISSISKERCEELEEGFYEAKYISLYKKNITDSSPLAYFKNLKKLDISDNNISDLTPLSNLTNLEELDISYNPVTDISPLKNLKLKSLDIFSNVPKPNSSHRVTGLPFDLSPVSKITTLKNLRIYGDGQSSPDLTKLVNLESLSLSDVDMSNLCKFKNAKELKNLSLYGKNLSDLKCIDNFQKLEELDIRMSPVSDLSLLQTLPNLKKLSIREVPVSDISPLAEVKSLESFSFYETNIKYLSPLKESTSLEYVMNESRFKLFTTRIFSGGLQMWAETLGQRSLEHCSPIDIQEIRAGISCFEEDGTLKSWWKRMLRL